MAAELPQELRVLVESGPLTYLSTTNRDGSPQVTAIWIGLDGDTIISTHMRFNAKLRNIERDPRVVLTFAPPQVPGDWLSPYAMLRATATVEPLAPIGHLLARFAKAYVGPDAEFPDEAQPGHVVRYAIEHVGGLGPWVPPAGPGADRATSS